MQDFLDRFFAYGIIACGIVGCMAIVVVLCMTAVALLKYVFGGC